MVTILKINLKINITLIKQLAGLYVLFLFMLFMPFGYVQGQHFELIESISPSCFDAGGTAVVALNGEYYLVAANSSPCGSNQPDKVFKFNPNNNNGKGGWDFLQNISGTQRSQSNASLVTRNNTIYGVTGGNASIDRTFSFTGSGGVFSHSWGCENCIKDAFDSKVFLAPDDQVYWMITGDRFAYTDLRSLNHTTGDPSGVLKAYGDGAEIDYFEMNGEAYMIMNHSPTQVLKWIDNTSYFSGANLLENFDACSFEYMQIDTDHYIVAQGSIAAGYNEVRVFKWNGSSFIRENSAEGDLTSLFGGEGSGPNGGEKCNRVEMQHITIGDTSGVHLLVDDAGKIAIWDRGLQKWIANSIYSELETTPTGQDYCPFVVNGKTYMTYASTTNGLHEIHTYLLCPARVSKEVTSLVKETNGSYTITYDMEFENITGSLPLKEVQVTDSLSITFPGASSITVNSLTNPTGGLTLNASYNGLANDTLLMGMDSIDVDSMERLVLVVNVQGLTLGQAYNNSVTLSGTFGGGEFSCDASDSFITPFESPTEINFPYGEFQTEQNLLGGNPAPIYEHFEINGTSYLYVAQEATFHIDIYKHDGLNFAAHQTISTGQYPRDASFFTINGEHYLSFGTLGGNDFQILEWNVGTEQFDSFQAFGLGSAGSYGTEYFVLNGESYLHVVIPGNCTTQTPASQLFKWDGSQFVFEQFLATNPGNASWCNLDSKYFNINGTHYLAKATWNTTTGAAEVWEWDGSQFFLKWSLDDFDASYGAVDFFESEGFSYLVFSSSINQDGGRVVVYQWDEMSNEFNLIQNFQNGTDKRGLDHFIVNDNSYLIISDLGTSGSEQICQWNPNTLSFDFLQNLSLKSFKSKAFVLNDEMYIASGSEVYKLVTHQPNITSPSDNDLLFASNINFTVQASQNSEYTPGSPPNGPNQLIARLGSGGTQIGSNVNANHNGTNTVTLDLSSYSGATTICFSEYEQVVPAGAITHESPDSCITINIVPQPLVNYDFEDGPGSSTVSDQSVNNNDLSLVGADPNLAWSGCSGTYESGNDWALHLTGDTEEASHSPVAGVGDAYHIGFWFKTAVEFPLNTNSPGRIKAIVDNSTSMIDESGVFIGEESNYFTNDNIVLTRDQDKRTAWNAGTISANTWHRIDFIWNGSMYEAYMDGAILPYATRTLAGSEVPLLPVNDFLFQGLAESDFWMDDFQIRNAPINLALHQEIYSNKTEQCASGIVYSDELGTMPTGASAVPNVLSLNASSTGLWDFRSQTLTDGTFAVRVLPTNLGETFELTSGPFVGGEAFTFVKDDNATECIQNINLFDRTIALNGLSGQTFNVVGDIANFDWDQFNCPPGATNFCFTADIVPGLLAISNGNLWIEPNTIFDPWNFTNPLELQFRGTQGNILTVHGTLVSERDWEFPSSITTIRGNAPNIDFHHLIKDGGTMIFRTNGPTSTQTADFNSATLTLQSDSPGTQANLLINDVPGSIIGSGVQVQDMLQTGTNIGLVHGSTGTDLGNNTAWFAAGITVTPTSGLTTTEAGGQATFTVVLNSIPNADVTIGLSSSNANEGTISPSSLTFTPANALTAQTVTLTGVNDCNMDGDISYTILTDPAVSTDSEYNGLDASDVSAINEDDDLAGGIFVVSNTNDSGPGSLREAINCANSSPGKNTITFNIPTTDPNYVQYEDDGLPGELTLANIAPVSGGGTIDPDYLSSWWRIQLASALPVVSDTLCIDGSSQPGTVCGQYLKIEISGALAGNNVHGISLQTGSENSEIKGLNINGFTSSGISAWPGEGLTIACCFIGTDISGTLDLGNGNHGVHITTGSNILIGGSNPESRNCISGNGVDGILFNQANNVTVFNNYIGTDYTGTESIKNNNDGVRAISTNNVFIGGNGTHEGNLISGNQHDGMELQLCDDVTIKNNIVGLNASGNSILANQVGINFSNAIGMKNYQIGENATNGRNIISGNTNDGIRGYGENITIVNNYIGTDISGTLDLGNGRYGIIFGGPSLNSQIGNDDDLGSRNVISGNDLGGIDIGTANGLVITNNYIGLDVTGSIAIPNTTTGINIFQSNDIQIGKSTINGRNVISGNNSRGLTVTMCDLVTIKNNYIGVDASGTVGIGNGLHGIYIGDGTFGTADVIIGSPGALGGNVISGNGRDGIFCSTLGDNTLLPRNLIQNNKIGTDHTGSLAIPNSGIGIWLSTCHNTNIGGAITGEGNIIAFNGDDGIHLTGSASSINNSFLGNQVWANGLLGINLGGQGVVTPNDPNDSDTGPNDLLNFPENLNFTLNGGNIDYQFDLDVPGPQDYHIEFFNNPSGIDPSGHGEGEEFIGAVSINHPGGGSMTFSGSFTPSTAVMVDDLLTTTTTEDLGMGDFGSTSEFSGNSIVCISPDITNITVADICLNVNAQAIILGNLDDGNYTITYNISGSNTATGLTTSMTVSGNSGGGTFTIPFANLPNVGTTTLTITQIDNDDTGCSTFGLNISDSFEVGSLVVTNTNDDGFGSLRCAIETANANPGADIITFNIPAGSVIDPDAGETGDEYFNIALLSPLPPFTGTTTINGFSQAQPYQATCGNSLVTSFGGGPKPRFTLILLNAEAFNDQPFYFSSSAPNVTVTIIGVMLVNYDMTGMQGSDNVGTNFSGNNKVILDCTFLGVKPN